MYVTAYDHIRLLPKVNFGFSQPSYCERHDKMYKIDGLGS